MAGRTLIRIGFLHAFLVDEPWGRQAERSAWRPPTDLFETEQEVVVQVEIAGMRREDFVVTFDAGVLQIAGYRRDVGRKMAYHMMEIPFGYFCTHVDLGAALPLAPEKMSAEYENGFLTVRMPKAGALDAD